MAHFIPQFIDAINERVFATLNDGVYLRAGSSSDGRRSSVGRGCSDMQGAQI
jgi:hypothetical protein